MSEKIENKAIELSDEEMGDVAGGKAVIVCDTTYSRAIFTCNSKGVNSSEFFDYRLYTNACGHFSKMSGLPAYNDPTYKDCRDCAYYHGGSSTLDAAEQQKDPKSYSQSGYDFKYVKVDRTSI